MENIIDFIAAPPNLPFLVASAVVIANAILNILFVILGYGALSSNDIDFSLDANNNGIPDYLETGGSGIFGWLNPGHVPSVILLIIFSGVFAISGFSGQWIYYNMFGELSNPLVMVPIALVVTLPVVRWLTGIISKILPHDESNAINLDSLVGSLGVLTIGPVNNAMSGNARFVDKYGTDHNLLVFGEGEENIDHGSQVVLLDAIFEKPFAYRVRKFS